MTLRASAPPAKGSKPRTGRTARTVAPAANPPAAENPRKFLWKDDPKMITVYHKHFEIEITSFINQQGNTSYMLDVFDWSKGGVFAYRLVRYQWGGSSSNYLICADSNGWCGPYDVRVKDLLDGFNWSCVRRALRERARFHDVWFPTLPF